MGVTLHYLVFEEYTGNELTFRRKTLNGGIEDRKHRERCVKQ